MVEMQSGCIEGEEEVKRGILVALTAAMVALASPLAKAGLDEAIKVYDAGEFGPALAEFRALAAGGDARAMSYVGWMLANGWGTAPSVEDGVRWMKRAVELGDPKAYFDYGGWLFYGRFVQRDPKRGIDFVRKAAEGGHLKAQAIFGVLYITSFMTSTQAPVTAKEALRWTKVAAERGQPDALNSMGFMYANGFLLKKNLPQAITWYRKAAAAKNLTALIELGAMYLKGEGVKADTVEAYSWFLLASRISLQFAKKRADKIAKGMTEAQLKEARQRADLWSAAHP
jgi:uncharacterized protein